MNEDFPQFESKYYEEAWDRIYKLFDKKRKSSYKAVSRLIRHAFDELYSALDYIQTKEFINRAAEEELYHNGTKVIVRYDEEKDKRDSETPYFLKALDEGIKHLKAYSLDYVLRQIVFILNLSGDRDFSEAGRYESGKVPQIVVHYRMSNIDYYVRTILHELGHHVYERILNKSFTKEWDALIESNYFPYTKDLQNELESTITSIYDKGEYKDLYDYFLTTISRSNKDNPYKESKRYDSMVIEHTLKYLEPDSFAYMILYNLNNNREYTPSVVPFFHDYEDKADHKRKFKNSLKFTLESVQELAGNYGKMLRTNISMYAGKNSEEAFCETFALFISDRWKEHKVSEEVIHFFKTIMSL